MKIILILIVLNVAWCEINSVNKGRPNVLDYVGKEGDRKHLSQAPEDDEDFFFTEDQKYEDVSIGLQSLFVALTEGMSTLKNQVSRVETKLEAVLDRLNHVDCYDLKMQNPLRTSGAYTLYMNHIGKRPVHVYCDMVTLGGGWTVIQQRLPRENTDARSKISFDRSYHEYQRGFGNPDDDYWIGLENMYIWTNNRAYELRIELEDFNDNKGHASYKTFSVSHRNDGYRLSIGGYSGDIGDSLANEGKFDNFTADGMMFSTKDTDQDTSHEINCASYWDIGGWWYNRCSWANLNAPYRFPTEKDGIGINWHQWKNKEYLKSTTMMIRPSFPYKPL